MTREGKLTNNFKNEEHILQKERTVKEILDFLESGEKEEKLGIIEANLLIETGKADTLTNNLDKFNGLDFFVASKIIEEHLNGLDIDISKLLDNFHSIYHERIASKLIKTRQGWLVANDLDKFKLVDHSKIANELIDNGYENALKDNIEKFRNLDFSVAEKLIDKNLGLTVLYNIKAFRNIYHSSIANKIIDDKYIAHILLNNIGKFFKELDASVANNLIDKGNVDVVVENLKKFKGLGSETANKLIDAGMIDKLIPALHNNIFSKLNSSTVNKFINAGKLDDITYCFGNKTEAEKLFDLDLAMANTFIAHKEFWTVVNYLEFFPELNHQELLNKIIEEGKGNIAAERIGEFKNIEPETIEYLQKYIEKNDSEDVYSLRNQHSLKELMANYDHFRVQSWKEESTLKPEDKQAFEMLGFIDENTLGKLWKNQQKEQLHIIGPQIIKMYELTGSNTDTFRGQFLERISNDGANYSHSNEQEDDYHSNMSAISYLNYIVENLNINSDSVFTEALSFEQTKLLAEKLKQEGAFKSWETLKKYFELSEVLKQREVLEKLENLRQQGKHKQYAFFTELAFHPGSKIAMQTVFEFMENPARFLDVEDQHSGKAHERKKPSNYTRFEYLDITAEDLRDALIEGSLDKLQYFKPFEAGYKIANINYSNQEVVDLLKKALGSFREKINGNARNSGKLFKVTQDILKKHSLSYQDVIANPTIVSLELQRDLENALFDNSNGIKDTREFEEYRVKIHPKSSPEGHLAGNDTACCMPFGSGKNNVYMYNLGCAILTVQRKVDNGYRTIAQSVLTPDVDIKHNISDLVKKVEDQTLLSSVITEDLTQKKKIIITADNIEVSPNAEKYKNSIEVIYSDFVSRYAHALDSNIIEQDRMLIGKGYSDLNFSRSKNIDNTFIPMTPVAYSDNYGKNVYELSLSEKSEITPLPKYGMLQKQEKEVIDPDLPRGVSYLTAHETLRVSYMEGKVYAENESLVQYIHRIGNELTAKDINNSFKRRPNLSFKVEDDAGAMLGYMIAYEGAQKSGSSNDEYDDYDNQSLNTTAVSESNQKVIYISDLAADTTRSKLAGGKLIKAFEAIIKREYLDKNNLLPIIAQARESTSYKIIQKQLNDLGKEYGYTYKLEENGSYDSGGDTMHQIKLIPVKI